MTTPVHMVLALTPEGMMDYKDRGCKGRYRSGIGKRDVAVVRKRLRELGFRPGKVELHEVAPSRMNTARKQMETRYFLTLARDRAKRMADWHTKVLVITDIDMFSLRTWYVVGQGDVDGRAAVVSIARLGSGDHDRYIRRVVTEAVHELGHTLGLGHCGDKDCVMYSSTKLPDSDIKSVELCDRCRIKVGRALRP